MSCAAEVLLLCLSPTEWGGCSFRVASCATLPCASRALFLWFQSWVVSCCGYCGIWWSVNSRRVGFHPYKYNIYIRCMPLALPWSPGIPRGWNACLPQTPRIHDRITSYPNGIRIVSYVFHPVGTCKPTAHLKPVPSRALEI